MSQAKPELDDQILGDAAGFRLHLLGTPRIISPTGELLPLERKDAALLALLALDGPIRRAAAADLLWPHADSKGSGNSLRQRLHRFRKTTGQRLIEPAMTLRLADGVAIDITGAESVLATDPHALEGELLGDFVYSDCEDLHLWVARARQQWQARRRSILEDLAETREQQSELARALLYAERVAHDEPTLEHAHRRVMRLHYLRHDRAAALAAYARCEVALERSRLRPSAETLELRRLVDLGSEVPRLVPAPIPLALRRPPRLVGRCRELEQMQSAWAAGQLVFLRGEPGVGKSRLLEEFAASMPGATVVSVRPRDAGVPYSTLEQILVGLHSAFGELPSALWKGELARFSTVFGTPSAVPMERSRAAGALRASIEHWAGVGLSIIVIDDLQFADSATLELLPVIANEVQQNVPRWLFGMRIAEIPEAVSKWEANLDPLCVLDLNLSALTLDETRRLLEDLALPGLDIDAWSERLHRHTGGNPLLMLETLRAAASRCDWTATAAIPASDTIDRMLERRLAQLSPDAMKVLRIAAVAGQDFSASLAVSILGETPIDLAAGWHELEASQVLKGSTFAHDLVAEAARRTVAQPIAELLHRQIAQFLSASDTHPARIAQHWLGGGCWEQAADACRTAALQARAAARPHDETMFWDRAIDLYVRAGIRAKAFASMNESIDARLAIADAAQVLAVTERMLADATDDAERLDAALKHANVLSHHNLPGPSCDAARRALTLAKALGDADKLVHATCMLARGMSINGQSEQALELLEPLRDWARAAADPKARVLYWSVYSESLLSSRRWEGYADALNEAVDAAGQAGDLPRQVVLLSNGTYSSLLRGRFTDALRNAARAKEFGDKLGGLGGVPEASMQYYLAMCYMALGKFQSALEAFEAALAQLSDANGAGWRPVIFTQRAKVWLELGQVARAQQDLNRINANASTSVACSRLLILARLARQIGKPRRALLEQAVEFGRDLGLAQQFNALLERSLDDAPENAAERCAEVRERAASHAMCAIATRAELMRIDCLLRAGAGFPSIVELSDAVSRLESASPVEMYPAEIGWILHRAFAAAGDEASASTWLRRAGEWIERTAEAEIEQSFRESFLYRNPMILKIRRALAGTS